MFRISKSDQPSTTVLVLDGQLCGEGIATVEDCCQQEIAKGKAVELLLRDLTNIDGAGKALLRRLVGRGVRLQASGIYTSYVVQTINTACALELDSSRSGRMRKETER